MIAIKGMKMPRSCKTCIFCDYRGDLKQNYCIILNDFFVGKNEKKNCPLVEVK